MPPGIPLPVAAGPPKTPAAPARATTPAARTTTPRTDDVRPQAPAGDAGCEAPVRPGIGAPFQRLPLRRTYRRAAYRRNYRCAFHRLTNRRVKFCR